MKSFVQFLIEYPVSDIRYFKELPDIEPNLDVLTCEKKYHLEGRLHWKVINNQSFSHSREMNDGIIGMVSGDIDENWYHELGHEIFDHSDKTKIKPVLDKIRDEYGLSSGGLKWVELDGYDYSYSHSGKEYEYDELFAISFAFYEGDHDHFDDTEIDKEFSDVLKNLQDKPLFKEDPYTSEGPVG